MSNIAIRQPTASSGKPQQEALLTPSSQVRPHASLDKLNPQEYIQSNYPLCLPQPSHMY
jgi:hypothetical protein